MNTPVKSPCINACCMNDDGFCQGCFRTEKEITWWTRYSEEQRREIVKAASQRRAEAGFIF